MKIPKDVASGLKRLAGLVESAGCADILGVDEEDDKEIARQWKEIKTAVAWVRKNVAVA